MECFCSQSQREGLVSYETVQTIQVLLREGGRVANLIDICQNFPLRGAVNCGDCGETLTSCWRTSKSGTKHSYYLCHKKGCVSYRKSIRRDVLEGNFAALLHRLEPSQDMLGVAERIECIGTEQACSD